MGTKGKKRDGEFGAIKPRGVDGNLVVVDSHRRGTFTYSVIHPDGNLHPDGNFHHHGCISTVLGEFRTQIDRSEIELPESERIMKNYQDLMNLDDLEGHQITILTQSQLLFCLS